MALHAEGEAPVTSIRVELVAPDAMELWRAVAKVATAFGEDRRWCLVGGLMVALFAIEARQTQRVTTDIDILADARARPSGTTWATGRLKALGASLRDPQQPELERGFRFDFNGQIVDVLAPDGLGPSGATTTGKLKTIQIPGGTQALNRTELVEIVVDELAVTLRRPKLIAAVLLKARALRVHSRPQDQRHDLITLLSLLKDIRIIRHQPDELSGCASSQTLAYELRTELLQFLAVDLAGHPAGRKRLMLGAHLKTLRTQQAIRVRRCPRAAHVGGVPRGAVLSDSATSVPLG